MRDNIPHEIKIALIVLSIISLAAFLYWPDLFQDDNDDDRYY